MLIKSETQVSNDLVNAYGDLQPGLDLSIGSSERDVFIDAPVTGALAGIQTSLSYIALMSSLLNWQSMETADLENLCANFLGQNPRISAKKSNGSVWFYAKSIPSNDITIPLGTQVSTTDGITFATTAERIMYKVIISSYYDITTGWYGIEVPVESIQTGATQNIGSNLITSLINPVSGIDIVKNKVSTSGASDAESDEALVTRAIESFQSKGLELTLGLKNFLLTQDDVQDAFVIGAGDPMMVRDDGLGGKLDAYIRGIVQTDYTQYATISSTGSTPNILLEKAPLLNMISVVGTRIYVEGTDYNITRTSSSAYYKSFREQAWLVWTSTGAVVGESLTIRYNYNGLLTTLYNTTILDDNHVANRDLLMFETSEVFINFSMSIYINGDQATIDAAIRAALTSDIASRSLGTKIERADEFNIVKSIEGIDNAPLDLFSLSASGITPDLYGDLQLSSSQYATAGSFVINYLT